MKMLSDYVRSPGDPKVIEAGPSVRGYGDRLGRALGWFSIGLGLFELFAPRRLTRALGMQGQEGLVRAFGVREIGAGVMTLSTEMPVGLWSRVAGDALDLAVLAKASHPLNRKRDNVNLAIAVVAGVTLLDLLGAQSVGASRKRIPGTRRHYAHRSGFPGGLDAARGAARDFVVPQDMRAAPAVA